MSPDSAKVCFDIHVIGKHPTHYLADSPRKRKRTDGEDEDDAFSDISQDLDMDAAMDEPEDIVDAEDDEEREYKAPAKPKALAKKRASPTKAKIQKLPKIPALKKPRARKQKATVDASQIAKETQISDDNGLFSTTTLPFHCNLLINICNRCHPQSSYRPSIYGGRLLRLFSVRLCSCSGGSYDLHSPMLRMQRYSQFGSNCRSRRYHRLP